MVCFKLGVGYDHFSCVVCLFMQITKMVLQTFMKSYARYDF
uniref:Uncharacterized protein n=1 Tax=Anguilla anguilla TaxID=7936 RepID=A0A0E9VMP0_ANGAN